MALIKCGACGNGVSENALSCPSCGEKPPKKTSRLVWAIGAFILIAMGMRACPPTIAPDTRAPEEIAQQAASEAVKKAAEERKNLAFNRAYAFTKATKSGLRDPDSLVWESVRANEDGSVICVEYRAKNGFGGMNREFSVFADGRVSNKLKDWNSFCLKGLSDMPGLR